MFGVQAWAYLQRTVGRNLILWDTVRIGDYELAREIVMNPTRGRTAALDGWLIQGGRESFVRGLTMPLHY